MNAKKTKKIMTCFFEKLQHSNSKKHIFKALKLFEFQKQLLMDTFLIQLT